MLLLCLSAAGAVDSGNYSGMVWANHGEWHLNGSPSALRLGEAIPPGGLLTAASEEGAQSLVVLLPDGQRLLCECYQATLCAQGFRVPPLTAPPSPAVWDMFVGVRNALLLRPATARDPFPPVAGRAALAANVEIVAALNQPGEISIVSALSVLPSGKYMVAVADDAPAATPGAAVAQPLNWVAPHGEATVHMPGPGVYRLRITDLFSVPRMQIEILVTKVDTFARESEELKQARDTVIRWSQTHPGWSLHDFLRAYLQSRATSVVQ
jgi:hypothetical protein